MVRLCLEQGCCAGLERSRYQGDSCPCATDLGQLIGDQPGQLGQACFLQFIFFTVLLCWRSGRGGVIGKDDLQLFFLLCIRRGLGLLNRIFRRGRGRGLHSLDQPLGCVLDLRLGLVNRRGMQTPRLSGSRHLGGGLLFDRGRLLGS